MLQRLAQVFDVLFWQAPLGFEKIADGVGSSVWGCEAHRTLSSYPGRIPIPTVLLGRCTLLAQPIILVIKLEEEPGRIIALHALLVRVFVFVQRIQFVILNRGRLLTS